MTPDLGTTNVWLAVLALASVAQLLLTCGAVFMGYRLYRQATTAVESIEHDQLRPFLMRANALIDDLQDMTARARTVDDAVRARIEGVESALHTTRTAVQDRLWPVIGAVRAVRAGIDAWFGQVGGSRRVPQG
jgi:hypothetical protein